MRGDLRTRPGTPWECASCREVVTVPAGAAPVALLVAVTGRPRQRVVSVDRVVVHRCAAGPVTAR